MRGILQWFVFSITLFVSFNMAASSANLVTCPTLENYMVSHFAVTIPYGYDAHTKKLKIFTVSEYLSDNNQALDFIIYPVSIMSGDNLIYNVNAVIAKLQPDNDRSLTFQINEEDGAVALCSYSVPGNSSVSAMLIADDSDIYDEKDLSNQNKKRARLRQLFMKQLG